MPVIAASREPRLLGRAAECQVLGRLLEEARADRRSAVLVIHGEAGVGKTALLDFCARQAAGFRLARIAGVESEMELPFAALHQLCAPLLGCVDALPVPQQNALRVAFGLSSGDGPNRFVVGLAALSLVAEVAVKTPLLCLVDDAQWLDAASRQVLGIVARRLLAESVVLVFAVCDRPDQRAFPGLPELALGGLAEVDARALMATAVAGRLDAGVRDRLIAETRGNPLALLELAQGSGTGHEPGGFGAVPARELFERIETSFVQRLAGVPQDARRRLLAPAADPLGAPVPPPRGAGRLGIGRPRPPDDTRGLRAISGRVAFLPPLVRWVVYRPAPPHDRRAVHLTLAEMTDPQVDADRR